MVMIKCPHCGETISETSKGCIFCGTPLEEEEIAVAVASAQEEMRERTVKKIEEQRKKEEAKSETLKLQAIKAKANASSRENVLDKLKKWKAEAIANSNKKYDKFAVKHSTQPSGAVYLLLVLGILLCVAFIVVSVILVEFFEAGAEEAGILLIVYPFVLILSCFLMWFPFYQTAAYEHRNIFSNNALIRYIKQEKIEMKEDVRKCLVDWKADYKEFVTNWVYVKKPSAFLLTNVSMSLSAFVAPILFAIGLSFLFSGFGFFPMEGIEIEGLGSPFKLGITIIIIGAVSLVLALIIAIYSALVKRMGDIVIFNFLRGNFPEEYPDSDATYIYGFVKTTKKTEYTTTEKVPTGKTTDSGVPIMKTVTVKKMIETPIPGIKRRSLALIFCIFLGWAGVNHFYNGQVKKGLGRIFTIGGFFGILWLVDLLTLIFFTPRYYIPQSK